MTDLVGKITKVLLLLMMAVTVIIAILFYIDIAGVKEGGATPTGWVEAFLKLSYIFGIVAAIAAVGFGLFKFVMKFVDKPMDGVKMLIPFIVLGIIAMVAYGYAADTALTIEGYTGTDNFDGSKALKWSGAGLIAMYLLAGLATLSIVFAEASKIVK